MLQPLSATAARVADLARGTLSAFWPRGTVSYEMSRLLEEGYTSGAPCDVAFSVGFDDPSAAAAAAQALRAARYVVDTSQSGRGFITVQDHLPLRAFDLGLALARLERVVARHSGFVALIGPTHSAPAAPAAPSRAESDAEFVADALAGEGATTRDRLVA